MKYIATFPAGAYDLIARQLKTFSLQELKIIEHDESSVIFESPLRVERLIELRYFTNIFLIIEKGTFPHHLLKGDYFRVMFLKNGEPQALPKEERTRLEKEIMKRFALLLNARLSLNDFYVLERRSGSQFLAFRLPRPKFKREEIAAGELRPELAHLLCLAAGIKAKQVVLDMFAGHGAIPLEAVRGFGVKRCLAVDTEVRKNRHERAGIEWHQADARHLDFIESASIDRIVTDPPWGAYDQETDLAELYDAMAKEMVRTLKPAGVAVVLSGYEGAERCLTSSGEMKLINKWNILVSGKKATIYKLQKK